MFHTERLKNGLPAASHFSVRLAKQPLCLNSNDLGPVYFRKMK